MPLPWSTKPRPAEERFREKFTVNPESGCWEWHGAMKSNGYGHFAIGNKNIVYAHRWAYEHWTGPIPEGTELDHLCRNRRCVNPAHLEAVSHLENIRRSPFNHKAYCKRGHEQTPENQHRCANGSVYCRLCARECQRNRAAAKRLSQETAMVRGEQDEDVVQPFTPSRRQVLRFENGLCR